MSENSLVQIPPICILTVKKISYLVHIDFKVGAFDMKL